MEGKVEGGREGGKSREGQIERIRNMVKAKQFSSAFFNSKLIEIDLRDLNLHILHTTHWRSGV